MDLAAKLKQKINIKPSTGQIAQIRGALEVYKAYLAGGYAEDETRPSDAVKFLKQFRNQIDKVVKMGLELESRLGPNQSRVPLLKCFSSTSNRRKLTMPDNQEVVIDDYSPALNEYYGLMDKLAQLSKGINSEISAVERTTQKGTTLDPWLMDTIKELAKVFENISGKPARREAIRATLRLSSPAWLAQPK